ncbi:hypothetical protein GCM10010191_49610 [Actinomadura vinacea]|uniref:Uncharacterized protein n=1 Tax=Actinomadura vinacea TaxID=115336 RepID=A0ABP5WLL6_9ACTN
MADAYADADGAEPGAVVEGDAGGALALGVSGGTWTECSTTPVHTGRVEVGLTAFSPGACSPVPGSGHPLLPQVAGSCR